MGAVDLVLQVESPKSVTAGLQRIGRAGHNVGDTSKGRIFPKFRADLLECAVVAQRMREGKIETTVVPRNPLDVLAQQIVAMAATGRGRAAAGRPAGGDARPHLHVLGAVARRSSRTCSTCSTAATRARSSASCGRGSCWDRVAARSAPARASRALAITNAGTIPDRGLYSVNLPDGRRVGELDEEMVYEARAGPGVPARRLVVADRGDHARPRDRHARAGRPGRGPVLEGRRARPPAGARRGDRRVRPLGGRSGAGDAGRELRPRREGRASNLVEFLREQQEATRVIPSDRTIVIERFRDEIGDWRVCVLVAVRRARARRLGPRALSARIREEYGLESDAIWSDDGIIVHLPDADEAPGEELMLIEPDELEDLVVGELGGSALFGARFRENAGRALLIPRAYPGRRTPLWQQRLKSQSLLEVARRYAQFPIVLETYREVLRDVLDLPGLHDLLTKLHRRELSLVEVETRDRFAVRLLAAVRLRRDLHVRGRPAQRRAPRGRAGAGSRAAARAARAGGAARADRPGRAGDGRGRPAAAVRAHAGRQRRRAARRAAPRRRPHAGRGASPRGGTQAWLEQLRGERRAIELRVGGEQRWVAAEDAGLYRDALGAVPPSGLPEAFIADVPDAMERLVAPLRPHARAVREPRAARPLRRSTSRRCWSGSSRPARSCAASCAPAGRRASGATPRCCAACAGPRWPRCAPRSSPPTSARSPASRPPGRASTATRRPARGSTACARSSCRSRGCALPLEVWERDVLPRRTGAYSPALAGPAVRVGRDRVGRRGGARAAARVASRCTSATTRRCIGPPPKPGEPPAEPVHEAHPRAPAGRRRASSPTCSTDVGGFPTEELQNGAVGSRVGGRGDQRRVRAAALARSSRPTPQWSQRARARTPAHVRLAPARRRAARGPGPLVADAARCSGRDDDPVGPPPHAGRAAARALRDRHPRAGAGRGHPGRLLLACTTRWRRWRRSASPAAATSSRAWAARSSRSRAPSSACGRRSDDDAAPPIVLAATDPAQPYGAVLKWPDTPRRPARQAGAYVVLAGAEPVLFVERGGKGLQVLVDGRRPAHRAVARRAGGSGQARADQAARAGEGRRRARRRAPPRRSRCSSSASAPARASSH